MPKYPSNPPQLDDAISSNYADEFIRSKFSDLLDHEITRQKINSVINDFVDKVDFMEKVRKYASAEIDSRMFRSVQYWAVVVITAIITTAIGLLIAKLWPS